MSVVVEPTNTVTLSPEDLLALPEGKTYELVNGRLVERKLGAESSWIGGEPFFLLRLYCADRNFGQVWPADNGYQCFTHEPGRVRRPDASFIAAGRLPVGELPRGFIKIAPDLVVEVVSPNDLMYELDEKLEDYRLAGVPLVWVISPETRTVTVYRGDGSVSRLHEPDELSGEEVIPGFTCRVGSIFPARPAKA